ncbi:MAG: acetyl-CoA carboxylase biotin carboxylase subunit [Anaerolineales bacterium]|nr:acetyl-CoA carboxylase biotin carboxylase subunit [Anaerolineales bacterium]
MFRKILIANRGEIAVRIIRACRELNIPAVAVYSDVDRHALHVRYADEAYRLGPAPSAESYLRIDKLLDIARACGADAVHPGYGFLAERADFAAACEQAGITFIGPRPSAIAAMGDKQVARLTVAQAGVPVVPGTEGQGNLQDSELLKIAPEIGFPLLIKATAGGGGKGMREVLNLQEMPGLLTAARREAKSSFGDDNVYLEKLVEGAHHIEFQILADQHGNVIHLGERECSIQRRHQKILEEAPAPFIDGDQELRERMGTVAVEAARAVDYLNAGTIEFLVDKQKNYYFLEMNTRLQVEHPVTEAVTGIDIVKEQIRIAAGKELSYRQKDIEFKGWSLECRINAEDPFRGFMPSTGVITQSLVPAGPGVRIDSGIYSGFEISPYYDALLAKLIVHESSREEAIARMKRALEEYKIIGVKTNIPFHQNLLRNETFLAGTYDTQFIANTPSRQLLNNTTDDYPQIAALAAALAAHRQNQHSALIIQRGTRDTSNWKWVGRWERTRD